MKDNILKDMARFYLGMICLISAIILAVFCFLELGLLYQQNQSGCSGDYYLDNATVCHKGLMGNLNGNPDNKFSWDDVQKGIPYMVIVIILIAIGSKVFVIYRKSKANTEVRKR